MIEARRYFIDSKARLRQIAAELTRFPVDAEHPLEVIVREPRREKTHDQRKLFHAICGEIGQHIGLTTGQAKELVKKDFYGEDEVRYKITYRDARGRTRTKIVKDTLVQSSEDSDRPEYTRLIDHAYQFAAERGIVVQERRASRSANNRSRA